MEKNYTFNVPIEEIYDYSVLEYSFALWQWGTPISSIPDANASDDDIFNHLLTISEPGYFTPDSPSASFFVQAARELGYYGYDIKPFKEYLTIRSSKGYLHRLMLPKELKDMNFDKTLSKKITTFLKKNRPQNDIHLRAERSVDSSRRYVAEKTRKISMCLSNPMEVTWHVSTHYPRRKRKKQ